MNRRVCSLLLMLGLALGLALVPAGAAQASPGYVTTKVTCASWSGIYQSFRTNWGTMAYRTNPPCTLDGELNGNTAYEPRAFYVGPHWCVTYWLDSSPNNKSYAQGGGAGRWVNIYLGDTFPYSYRTVMESWYGGWCP